MSTATATTTRRPPRAPQAARPPSIENTGRIPDKTFAKFHAALARLTPAQFRRRLVEYGIIDKDGNRLYPAP